MRGQIAVVGRVEGSGERRKPAYQHVMRGLGDGGCGGGHMGALMRAVD
jgi:hypothetical protein